jgi:hypothetical protein
MLAKLMCESKATTPSIVARETLSSARPFRVASRKSRVERLHEPALVAFAEFYARDAFHIGHEFIESTAALDSARHQLRPLGGMEFDDSLIRPTTAKAIAESPVGEDTLYEVLAQTRIIEAALVFDR